MVTSSHCNQQVPTESHTQTYFILTHTFLFKSTISEQTLSDNLCFKCVYESYGADKSLACAKLTCTSDSEWISDTKSNSTRPISVECVTAPNLSCVAQEAEQRAATAPLGALLCLFKYSRQCCWSVWERRAHGAALPLRSVKQPSFSSDRRQKRQDDSPPESHPRFDPNTWQERWKRIVECFNVAGVDWWAPQGH